MDEIQENIPRIDQDVTINIFKKFAGVNEVDERVAEYIMLSGDAFWDFMIKGWEGYASHAGRQHIKKSDIQLHMLRTGLVGNSSDFSALVTSHLPQDLAVNVLEIARGRNRVAKRGRMQPVSAKSVSPKTKDMNAALISTGNIAARRRLFSHTDLDVPNPASTE